MKTFFGIIFAVLFVLTRWILFFPGLIAVWFVDQEYHPIWGNEQEPYPPSSFDGKWWYRPPDYKHRALVAWWWNAVRNPTNNMRNYFKDPAENVKVAADLRNTDIRMKGVWDPDKYVRGRRTELLRQTSAYRLVLGWFPEFWYLKAFKKPFFGKPYFEVRIGWKHGWTKGFVPTFQFGPRS